MGHPMVTLKSVILTLIGFLNLANAQEVYWSRTAGPEGRGTYNTIIRYASDTFIVGTQSGVFISTDDGVGWNAAGLPTENITTLGHLRGNYLFAGSQGGGCFRSGDFGQMWSKVMDNGAGWHSITTDGDSTVYIAGYLSVARSKDMGSSWTSVISLGEYRNPQYFISVLIDRDANVVAASNVRGVYRSTTHGDTWNEFNTGIGDKNLSSMIVDSSGNLFATASSGRLFRCVYGDSMWTEILSIPSRGKRLGFQDPGSIYLQTDSLILRSTNEGDDWEQLNSPVKNSFSGGNPIFAFSPAGKILMSAGRGLFTTTTVSIWSEIDLPIGDVRCMSNEMQNVVYSGTSGGVFGSTDRGMTWRHVGSNDFVFSIGTNAAGDICTNTDNGIWYSTDGGDAWSGFFWGYSNPGTIAFRSDGWAYYGRERLIHSTNRGVSWVGGANLVFPESKILTLQFVGEDIIAGLDGAGMYRSSNNGDDWIQVPGFPGSAYVVTSAQTPAGALLFGTDVDGIFRSTDGGVSWSNVGFTGYRFSSFLSDRSGLVYMTAKSYSETTWHVYRSSDIGTTWKDVTNGLPGLEYTSLALTSDDRILVGTIQGGVYISTRLLTDSREVDQVLPDNYDLLQNYPNPFNPSTTIKISIPERGHMSLIVYDAIGRQVAVLVDGNFNPGEYDIELDGRSLTSGVYYARLRGGDYNKAIKILLLK